MQKVLLTEFNRYFCGIFYVFSHPAIPLKEHKKSPVLTELNWCFNENFIPFALLIETFAEKSQSYINEKHFIIIIFSCHWLPIVWTRIIKVTTEINIFSIIVSFMQIFTHCHIIIWYSWVPHKWGVWINGGEVVRTFWINKWEGWKNIENLIARGGKDK